MSDPSVSIVMPVYNASRYLREALDSVLLAQTYREFELLVCDDGSSDESPRIIAEYAARDPRVRVFRNDHAGIVRQMNLGLEAARGTFLVMMHADDVAMPRRLERQVQYLRDNPCCVAVGSAVELIDPEGWPICTLRLPTEHEQIDALLMRGRGQAIIHPAATFRREAMLAVGGYQQEYQTAEDMDLYLRLGERGRLANLPEALLKYRRHFGSISHSAHDTMVKAARGAVAEACRRRGIAGAAAQRLERYRPEGELPAVAFRMQWVLQAGRAGHYRTAAKHLCAVLRQGPLQAAAFAARNVLGYARFRLKRLLARSCASPHIQ